MDIISNIKEKAKADKQWIVFPEGEEQRVIDAVKQIFEEDLVKVILLGNVDTIKKMLASVGVTDINDNVLKIIDPKDTNNPYFEKYASEFFEMRKAKGITIEDAQKTIQDESYFGTMMVQLNDANGLVSGSIHSTADTVRPALQIIKTKPGLKTASSYFVMIKGDEKLIFGDCGMNISPTIEQLADIAISSNDSAKDFGIEPKVAMLSFSTKCSARHPDAQRVIDAVSIVKEARKDIKIDGELQFDAAYDQNVAKTKCPDSEIAGNANVFIFPTLDAGNIAYKIAQRMGGYRALGPITQGLNKPVNDLSRGCSAQDIVEVAVITAMQAQQQ